MSSLMRKYPILVNLVIIIIVALRGIMIANISLAIFTNLTQDHLDYLITMDNYFNAKAKLFAGLKEGAGAVINLDDKDSINLFLFENNVVIGTSVAKTYWLSFTGENGLNIGMMKV